VPSHKADELHQEKRGRSAAERHEFLRAAWRVMVGGALDPRRLLFIDECGTHTSLAPVYGYAPRGERLGLSVPRNRGKNTTLLASITLEGMGPSLAVEGSTTAEVFEAYLERVLLPEVEEGQVVVMDSLPAHKPGRVRELIEGRGCELLYLPGYSPDYNPIEEAFSKIKQILRRACARTREALLEALGEALSAVSFRDAQGFFEHAGYRPMDHLL
jgi:transposase